MPRGAQVVCPDGETVCTSEDTGGRSCSVGGACVGSELASLLGSGDALPSETTASSDARAEAAEAGAGGSTGGSGSTPAPSAAPAPAPPATKKKDKVREKGEVGVVW